MAETIDEPGTGLALIEEELRKELAGLHTQVEAPSSNKISTKGKLFKLPGGASSPGPMRVIVLDFIAYNAYYPGAYNANVRALPICWAINKNIKALAPSEVVPQKQSPTCETCAKNQWQSGQNGKGKACKNQRRLLVTAVDFTDATEPMTLYVSPTAIKHWDKYVRDCASEHGALPVQVITEISFDANQSYPTLLFSMVGKHGRLESAMRLRSRYQELLTREPDPSAEAA